MALVKKQEPDYARSIPLRIDRSLGAKFSPLRHWFTCEVLRFHQLGIPRKRSILHQIEAAVDCVLANFLDAHRISPQCFVAISLSEGTYTKSRYFQTSFGYRNLRRVLDFFRQTKPAYVIFKKGFHDTRGKKAIGKVSRFAPSDQLLQLIKGCINVVDAYLQAGDFNVNDVVRDAYAFAHANPLPRSRRVFVSTSATVHQPAIDILRLKNSARKLVNFDDTELTNGMRERLQRWNEFISCAQSHRASSYNGKNCLTYRSCFLTCTCGAPLSPARLVLRIS